MRNSAHFYVDVRNIVHGLGAVKRFSAHFFRYERNNDHPASGTARSGAFVAQAFHFQIAYPAAVIAGSLAYVTIDRNIMRLRVKVYGPSPGKALMATAYWLLAIGIAYAHYPLI